MKRLFAVVLTLVALLAFLPQPAMAQKHHRRIDPNQVDKIQCQTYGYCGGRFYNSREYGRNYNRRGYGRYDHGTNAGDVAIAVVRGTAGVLIAREESRRGPDVVVINQEPESQPDYRYERYPESDRNVRHEQPRMEVKQGVIRLIHNRSGAPALVRVGDAPCFTLEDGGEARRVPGSPALISADLIIGTKPDGEPLTAAACIRGMAHPGHVQILPAGSQKCGG